MKKWKIGDEVTNQKECCCANSKTKVTIVGIFTDNNSGRLSNGNHCNDFNRHLIKTNKRRDMSRKKDVKITTHTNDDGSVSINVQSTSERETRTDGHLLAEAISVANDFDLRNMIYKISLDKLIRIAQITHGRMYKLLKTHC